MRPAFSDQDIAARRWFAEQARAAGLSVAWDPVGNVFALPVGDDPTILIGSHGDTQPEGGWLDGAYGVVCGLEIARAAQEAGIGGVAAVSFSDEEGRFGPLLGSRYWTGTVAESELGALTDHDGYGLAGLRAWVPELRDAMPVPVERFRYYLEPHIEQGPVLDAANDEVGVVTAIAGLRHLELVVIGDQNHAGTTPMAHRNDALQTFMAFARVAADRFAAIASPVAVWTFGKLDVHPNATSIIPGEVRSVLQIRDAELGGLDALTDCALALSAEHGIAARVVSAIDPVQLDGNLVDVLDGAARRLAPKTTRRMISGALHDAGIVAARLPAAMLFVPSIGGRSHRFDEDSHLEHLVLGCVVAARAVAGLL